MPLLDHFDFNPRHLLRLTIFNVIPTSGTAIISGIIIVVAVIIERLRNCKA